MKKLLMAVLILVLSSCSKENPKDIQLNVQKEVLPNGLTLLLVNRDGAPVFSTYVRVKVGGMEETKGSSGLAHFFEHMAFKGTSKIGTKDFSKEKPLLDHLHELGTKITQDRLAGKSESELAPLLDEFKKISAENDALIEQNEFVKIIQSNGGGDLNATTSNDFTSYFVSFPSEKLELWAYMESERIKDPVLREFYKERDVVFEERLMRYENSPEGKLYEQFMDASFDKSPYKINVIGYPQDIKSYTAEAAKNFRDTFYIPSRMVVAVVGHFSDSKQAFDVLKKYFSTIPPKTDVKTDFAKEPLTGFPRERIVEFDSAPRFYMGYHRPAYPHPDDMLFDVLEQVLCQGRTARLYQSLVVDKKVASSVDCYASLPGNRLDGLFSFFAVPLEPHSNKEVQKAILDELEKLKKEGISDEEISRVEHQIDADMIYSLESNMGLASMLSFFEVLTGDWHYLYELRDRMHKITSDEIKRMAKTYFVPEKQSTVYLEKKGGAQ